MEEGLGGRYMCSAVKLSPSSVHIVGSLLGRTNLMRHHDRLEFINRWEPDTEDLGVNEYRVIYDGAAAGFASSSQLPPP